MSQSADLTEEEIVDLRDLSARVRAPSTSDSAAEALQPDNSTPVSPCGC